MGASCCHPQAEDEDMVADEIDAKKLRRILVTTFFFAQRNPKPFRLLKLFCV